MILAWWVGMALADDGQLVLGWRKDLGLVRLEAPAGEHLAEDAPTRLEIETSAGRYTVDWGDLVGGVPVPLGAGGPVNGRVLFSLCEDGGTACRVIDGAFRGTVQGRRGEQVLAWEAEPVPPESTAQTSIGSPVEDALALAADTGRPLLIDFGAHWCPPCQVLAAEVFDDPDNAADLAPFVVLEVDADHPDSWALKDRFAVGGYPTVLVASPQLQEIGRHVGYSTESEFLGWLSAQQGPGLDDRLSVVEEMNDEEKGRLALALLAADRGEEAASLVDGVAGVDAALVSFRLAPDPGEVPWLATEIPGRWNEWIWWAMGLDLSAETRATLRVLVADQAAAAETSEAAALAYLAGQLAGDPVEARAFSALGAQLIAGQMTGDPAHDRGFWLEQASFLEGAGQVDAAVSVLRQGQRAWPGEFTWPHNIAGILQRAGRTDEALLEAQAARAAGYGDQVLRATAREAELLASLDRSDEAQVLLGEVLAAAERPAEGTQVRTFRYLAALEALQAELSEP